MASILSILISRSDLGDILIWHHSKNGEYTVKSGYGLALGLMENGDLGKKGFGAPSSTSNLKQVWNKIWSLDVPNKLKFFVWKCCNNALLVRKT